MITAFLSHNSKDKPFARRLKKELEAFDIACWIDESEIHFGESLISKISSAIHEIDVVVAIISSNSVSSPWVNRELEWALNREITNSKIIVIPILIDKCDIPFFLRDKLYGDFLSKQLFLHNCKRLADAIHFHANDQKTNNYSKDEKIPYGASHIKAPIPNRSKYYLYAGLFLCGILFSLILMIASPDFSNLKRVGIMSCLFLCLAQIFGAASSFTSDTMKRRDANFAKEMGNIIISGWLSRNYRRVIFKYKRYPLICFSVFLDFITYFLLFISGIFAISCILYW